MKIKKQNLKSYDEYITQMDQQMNLQQSKQISQRILGVEERKQRVETLKNQFETRRENFGKKVGRNYLSVEQIQNMLIQRENEIKEQQEETKRKIEEINSQFKKSNPATVKQNTNKEQKNKGLGNIDLTNRPVVKNNEGSISTIRSISFFDDKEKKEILIPTVINGKIVSDDEAIQNYYKTGQYLGKFNTVEEANNYADYLHKQQEEMYGNVKLASSEETKNAKPLSHKEEFKLTEGKVDRRNKAEKVVDSVTGIAGNIAMGIESLPSNVVKYANQAGKVATRKATKEIAEKILNIEDVPNIIEDVGEELVWNNKLNPLSNVNSRINSKGMEEWRKETIQQNLLKASSNPLTKKVAEIAPSVGQNIVPMMVSAVNPILGTALFITSAGGSYLDEAKQRGMNENQAFAFATVMGSFEGATEAVISGKMVSNAKKLFTGVGIKKEILESVGVTTTENFFQEAIIEPLQEITAQVVGGKDKANYENLLNRSLESGIDGILSAIILNGASVGVGSAAKVLNAENVSEQEKQKAVEDTINSGKVDIKSIVEGARQAIFNFVNNSQENVQQNATNNQFIQDSQQVTPLQQENAQNGNISQINTNTQNMSNLMQTAIQYNKDTNDTSLKLVDEMLNRRNITGKFDETLFNDNNVNAIWRVTGINEDGTPQREVIFNPNTDSKTALIELSVHEIAHDLEGGDTYTKLSKNILENLQSKENYAEIRQTYEKAYSKVYDENSNVFSELINDEIVADTLAKNLGSQDFVDELVNQDRSTMQKIWDWIKQKINSLKGNTDEKVYWQDIANKFEKAFNQGYQGTSEKTTKYFIETVENFDETEYNNTKGIMLPKKEYGILSHIINSDSNIKPGLNYVETTNARYTVYYKETGEFKVIDKEINDGNSRNDTTTKRDISRSNTTGNEKTGSNLSSTKVQYGETRTNNDKISSINKERTRERIRSDFSSEKNIGNSIEDSNQSSFSMQENIKEFDITNGLDDYNGTTSIFFDTTEKGYHVTATGKGGELINDATFIDKKGLTRHFGEELAEYIIQNSKVDNMEEVKVKANESKDYRMAHRPSELGANASDISNNGEVMPKDVYEHPEWYFDMTKEYSKESLEILKNIKGNPEAEITIYRATTGNKINEGDWVTLSKKYAEHHNNTQFNGEGNVVELRVKAKDVQFAGDDINEFGYFPENKSKVESFNVVEDNKGRKLTKEQQEFFKDSKVLDRNGNLLTLYHGTGNDFNIFNIERLGSGQKNAGNYGDGFYFTPSKYQANDYAKDGKIKEVYLDIKNPFIYSQLSEINGENIFSEFVDIYNLVKINDEWGNIPIKYGSKQTWNDIKDAVQNFINTGEDINNIDEEMYKQFGELAEQGLNERIYIYAKNNGYKTLRETLKKKGYDGIFSDNVMSDNTQYVAFESNQIKNVDNLNPTDNEDIRYSIDNQEIDDWLNKNVPHEGKKGKTIAELNVAPIKKDTVNKNEKNKSFEDILDEIDFFDDTEEIKSPLQDRDISTIGKNKKINAYQYENPKVKPYFQEMAEMIGEDLSYIASSDNRSSNKGGGTTLTTNTNAIEQLHKDFGYSYDQIAEGLKNIIEDKGSENNAVSKKIEFFLDDQLRNGYRNALGKYISPNEEYINTISSENETIQEKPVAPLPENNVENNQNKEKTSRFNGYTQKEIENITSKKISIANNKEDLVKFADNVRKIPGNFKIYAGKITKKTSKFIREKLGINVEDYNISLKSKQIIHSLNHHSNKKEVLRGQVPITSEDFANIPEIINNPDKVEFAGNTPQGKPALKFEKNINGHNVVVTYVSDKHHNLELQTMYKFKNNKKINPVTVSNVDNTLDRTSETNSDTDLLNNSIPQNEKNNNMAEKANNDDTLTIPVEENKQKDIAPLGRNARMRKHYDTVMKSPTTSKEAKKIARELMGTDTYVAEANQKQLKRADERIKNNQDGVDGELKALSAKLASGENFNTNDMAVSMRLEEYYSKTGDKAKLQEAIQLTAMAGTQAGRTVQELSMIKRMTSQGQAIWIQRTVDDMNGKLARRKGGKIVTDEYGIPVKNEDGKIKVVDKKGKDISNKVNLFDLTPDMLSKIRNSTKENLQQNIDEVYSQLGNQVAKDVWQKLDSWRYFSMLANLRTHIRNITGNIGMGATQKVKNKVAGAIEDIVSTVNPKMERTHTLRIASQEVKDFAKKDINNVKERLYDGNKYNPKSRLENSMRTFESETLEQTLGRLFNMNDKALEIEDGWGLKAGYVRAMADYMTANKLTPKNITDKQLSTARNYAIEQAKEATFHQVSKLATAIENLSRKNSFTKFTTDAILPFKKTPINIAKAGASYSPVGLAKSVIVDTVQLRKGNITVNQYIDNMSKGLTGTGIAFLGYVLTDIGILKASGGDDDDKKNYDESLGNQTYSIKIGENTYSLDWLTPSGIPLFIGSELCQIAQRKEKVKESSTDEDSNYNQIIETGSNILNAFSNSMNPMAEMSLLSGLTSALQSYEQGSSQMFAAMGTNAGKSYINQYVPTLLGQIAKTFDDYERATTTTKTGILSKAVDQAKNQIMSKIPGLRQELPIKTDIWGNEIKQSDDIITRTFENGIAPWTRRSLASSKVDEEIDNLYEKIGESSIIPKRIPKNITINSQNYRLTNEEYIKYQKEYGQVAYKLLDKIVTSKEYSKLSDTQKQKVIEEVYSYSKEKNKIDYAKKVKQTIETSTTYNVIEKLKKSGLNDGDYFNYIGKTKELEDSEKKAILENSSYSEETKDIIYTNTIGKQDKTYKYVSNVNVNFSTYAKATNRIKEIKDEYASTENMTSKQKTAMTKKRKTQVLSYINSLELSRQQKLILQKTIGGYSIKDYKSEVVEYVSRLNLTNAEREEMISKLFK